MNANEKKENTLILLLKVLGEEIRLRLLNLLSQHELMVGEIQEILSIKQSNLSSHLNLLKKHKLLTSRREGQKIFYQRINSSDSDIDGLLKKILDQAKTFTWHTQDVKKIDQVLEKRKKTSLLFFNQKEKELETPGQLPDALLFGFIQLINQKTILDMGCGEGNLSYLLALADNLVYGIDNSTRQIELAQQKNLFKNPQGKLQTHYSCQDMEKTNFKANFFDMVCICHSLHHTGHPLFALQESHRVLKPKGQLMIFDLNQHQSKKMEKEYGDFWMGFESSTLKEWLLQTQFTIITYQVLSETHYPIKKKIPQGVSPLIVVAKK